MKKLVLILLMAVFSHSVHSQENLGFFAGVNYSYFTDGFAGKVYAESSIGLQIGALYNMELTDRISFRPKLFISQQGDRTKTEQESNFELNQIDYKLTYLNTSLDFKFWDKIYLITGPQVGFLLNQKPESIDFGKVKSTVDLGVNLGGGFRVNKLFFELGIYQGLSTLFEYDYYTGSETKVKNGYAKFTVGYSL